MTKTKTKKPDPEELKKHVGDDPQSAEEEKPQRIEQLIKVSGQSTKAAVIQTHNLKKSKTGELLPELIQGALDDE